MRVCACACLFIPLSALSQLSWKPLLRVSAPSVPTPNCRDARKSAILRPEAAVDCPDEPRVLVRDSALYLLFIVHVVFIHSVWKLGGVEGDVETAFAVTT